MKKTPAATNEERAILFDLDGTLLDTLEDIACSVNRVLSTRGFKTHPIDRFRQFIGDGSKMLVARALPQKQRTEKMIGECLLAFFKDYDENFDQMTRVYPGIPELLNAMRLLHVKSAVLSNKRHDLTLKCVNRFLRQWHFDAVFGLRDGVPKKPDPAGAIEISHAIHVPPERITYVGDSGTDMQTARAAGMFPVGAVWGLRSKQELLDSGAQALIASPLEVLDLI